MFYSDKSLLARIIIYLIINYFIDVMMRWPQYHAKRVLEVYRQIFGCVYPILLVKYSLPLSVTYCYLPKFFVNYCTFWYFSHFF